MADPEAGIAFRKGHGTQNDFVVLPDPDGALELTPARVRGLCDRRRGLGADGVLRVVRASAPAGSGADGATGLAEWFMDYRNADGSTAEMCGNGIRVFARYLVEAGLAAPGELLVGTRAGPRWVRVPAEAAAPVSVAMGPVRVAGTSTARIGDLVLPGVVVDVGNPHLACVLERDPDLLDLLDLREPPGYDAAVFPRGVNVEVLTPVHDGAVRMRVYERGVGETRSCGTGAVAAAVAALRHRGATDPAGPASSVAAPDEVLAVCVPGGTVRVALSPPTAAGGREATLTGPAVLVAGGALDPGWWRSLSD